MAGTGPRDLTRGGQVAFMRLKMFLQINNLFYVIIRDGFICHCCPADAISIQNLLSRYYLLVRACHVALYRTAGKPAGVYHSIL